MKLSRLYSNNSNLFKPIDFSSGLNVVMAEIRLHKDNKKDTHNLGKTTLGRLIDFCLLSSPDKNFFLLKHSELFKNFIFFIEIELIDGLFVTIRRKVTESSKLSFKKSRLSHQDFSTLYDQAWDHFEMPFDKAKDFLDSLLDLRALKPWPFRKELGYLLRSQVDFGDVFQLRKFASKHVNWKPFIAHVLGFNAEIITQHYAKETAIEKKVTEESIIKKELNGNVEDISKIEGILLLKQKDCEKKQNLIDSFDFRSEDKEKTKQLVDKIDEQIAMLNSERYSLSQNKKKITLSLEEDQILFNPSEAQRLFQEVGVLFEGQIKRDFEQLIAFNKAITDERSIYLQEELAEIESSLKRINTELSGLGKQRSETLSFLSSADIFNKYKKITDELVILRADITSLERQRSHMHRLQELRAEIRSLEEEKGKFQTQIEQDVEAKNSDSTSLFSIIRLYFNEIIEEVIDRQAVLSVSPNKNGHLEFKAEILDETGNITSADLGHTYRKLLCVAFDLAVLRAHLDQKFPRFVYHDGVFESLDDRKKENLLGVIRRYMNLGIQQIITLIDSDLPIQKNIQNKIPIFNEKEIILVLHDESESGRLFKMKAW